MRPRIPLFFLLALAGVICTSHAERHGESEGDGQVPTANVPPTPGPGRGASMNSATSSGKKLLRDKEASKKKESESDKQTNKKTDKKMDKN